MLFGCTKFGELGGIPSSVNNKVLPSVIMLHIQLVNLYEFLPPFIYFSTEVFRMGCQSYILGCGRLTNIGRRDTSETSN